MKVRRLKRLRIKRVDLVENGANQEAAVILFKSEDITKYIRHEGDKWVVYSEAGDKLGEHDTEEAARAQLAAVESNKRKKAAQAAKEKQMPDESTEQIKKLQEDLTAATQLAEEEARKREAVEKSLKEQADTLATLKKQVDEARDAAKLAEFKKTVDAFEHLPVKADVFAPILKKAADVLDKAEFEELMRVLKAADNAGAGNFSEIGTGGHDTVVRSATEEADAKADELVAKSSGSLDKNKALGIVMAQNPKLAHRVRRESYTTSQVES